MKVFDFRFNLQKKNIALNCCYCQPKGKRAALFIIGEIINAFSEDKIVLEQLVDKIKKEFYQGEEPAADRLKRALREGNKFLESLSRQGNINWLGNLNFAVLCIDGFDLMFSKTGNIKILLQRKQEFLDISENLEFQHLPFSSLEKFSNIALGKVILNDRLYIMTSQIANLLSEDLLEQFLVLPKLKFRDIKKIIKKRKEFRKVSGIFLLVFIDSFRKKQFK